MAKQIHPGDDGLTNTLGSERIPKFHLRIETLGSIDEADACFGLLRAVSTDETILSICQRVMKFLHTAMAEVSNDIGNDARIPYLVHSDIVWLEDMIEELGKNAIAPSGFILAGDTIPSAYINQARTAVRRAERFVDRMIAEKMISPGALMGVFNRLGTLCYYMQVWQIRSEGKNISLVQD
jgi:cob(I)alamin adenosyltransferase